MRNAASQKAYAESTLPGGAATAPRVGRKMLYPEKCIAPFAAGTFARIGQVLGEGEDRTDLIREAVERELQRRSRGLSKTPNPKAHKGD